MDDYNVPNQMVIPPASLRDDHAVEMLRVWIAERGLHCSMRVGMYNERKNVRDEVAWGKILADTARHLSNALAAEGVVVAHSILQDIREAFLRELDNPTTGVRGAVRGQSLMPRVSEAMLANRDMQRTPLLSRSLAGHGAA